MSLIVSSNDPFESQVFTRGVSMFQNGKELLESGCNFAIIGNTKYFIMSVHNDTLWLEGRDGIIKKNIDEVSEFEKIGGKMY